MKKSAGYFIAILLLANLYACSGNSENKSPPETLVERIEIYRLLMHTESHYTVLVKSNTGSYYKERAIYPEFDPRCFAREIRYFFDVAPDKSRWALLIFPKSDFHAGFGLNSRICGAEYPIAVEFHLISPEDINGAGWNRGKFGSGQTQVIQ